MANFQKTKKGNVVHRTTSETLRLGDDILNSSIRVATQGPLPRKKGQLQATSPNCSFQITGVSLTRSDYGEDSADDLDESHTDDISRITDNETPSFSEDSRDTDDPQQIVFTSTAAALQPLLLSNDQEVKRKMDQPEAAKCITRLETQIGRFKITKIESPPINRGRWTCVDYKEETETDFQSALIICDNEGNAQQSAILQDINNPHFTEDDSSNKNNQLNDQTGIANNSTGNCQESYYYSGSIVMPNNAATAVFPLTVESPPRGMIRYAANIFPSTLEGPIRNLLAPSFSTPRNITVAPKPQLVSVFLQNTEPGQVYEQQLVQSDSNKNSSASVSCTATIDTKIEHALDVVKNHLTHAVRMEVAELKVKINELVDRITYLEYENDVLRANVAPEVLENLDNMSGK